MATCPFCGVTTETPHDTQQRCIDALSAEIARMRAILAQVKSTAVPGPPPDLDNDDPSSLPRP